MVVIFFMLKPVLFPSPLHLSGSITTMVALCPVNGIKVRIIYIIKEQILMKLCFKMPGYLTW